MGIAGATPLAFPATHLPYFKHPLQQEDQEPVDLLILIRQPLEPTLLRRAMSLHHITWRATVSGLADETVAADALAWLMDDDETVEIERTSSYYGSEIHMVEARTTRKGPALSSLARLGSATLETLLSEVEQRLDESHTFHMRLDFNALINGTVQLSAPGNGPTIKGHAKVQVFPGQEAGTETHSTLQAALKIALAAEQ